MNFDFRGVGTRNKASQAVPQRVWALCHGIEGSIQGNRADGLQWFSHRSKAAGG